MGPGKPFFWGIVGTGAIARQFASDLSRIADARLGAVSSRDLEKARSFQQHFGGTSAYASLEEMLCDPAVDAIYIATPNSLHAEQALAAIAAGKPVLVEKPLAVNAAQALDVKEAAERQRVFVMEAMWTRFLPAVRAAHGAISGGAIGQVRRITGELAYLKPEDDNRFFRPDLGGGAALDLGVYALSLAIHFLGKPTAVKGTVLRSRSGVDLSTEFELDFADADARLACGFDRVGTNQFLIEGTNGAIRLEAPFLKAMRLARYAAGKDVVLSHPPGFLARLADRLPVPGRRVEQFRFQGNGLQFEAQAVMDAVRRGERTCALMPLDESVLTLSIIDSVVGAGQRS